MDEATKRAYIRIRLERVYEDIESARSNLQHGQRRTAVNRAYYAIFHIASAALVWQEIERSRHSGIESAFIEFLVKPGQIESEFGQIYMKSRRMREKQDYDLEAEPLSEEKTQHVIDDATRFVNRMEHYLRESGALTEDADT